MRLYLKQKVFSFRDKFTLYDENGHDRYYVEGEVFSFGKKLHIMDTAGNELAMIRQRLMTFLPCYSVEIGGATVAEVVKKFTFFRNEYTIEGLGWTVHGNMFDHEYEIYSGNQIVAQVRKEWFTFGDAYEIEISPNAHFVTALAVVLVIDACLEQQSD
ncbi:MAG: LURP-one-related family protein [Clostridia bacterium]|nr:LURP-one-related family protein [Clostridia bacterium]